MNRAELFRELQKHIDADQGQLAEWSRNYLRFHKARYNFDLDMIERYYRTGMILEAGSAPYHLTLLMKLAGWPVKGVDIDPSRQAGFIQSAGLDVVQSNIETARLPFEDESFHYIIFNEIFEHLRINPIATLREMRRVLHPDGVMVLSTPNLYDVRNVINLLRGKGFDDPFEQFSKLESIGHMGHVREYTPAQVRKFLTETGFEVRETKMHSHTPLKGMWRPFNLFRKVFPFFHRFQVHVVSRKAM